MEGSRGSFHLIPSHDGLAPCSSGMREQNILRGATVGNFGPLLLVRRPHATWSCGLVVILTKEVGLLPFLISPLPSKCWAAARQQRQRESFPQC